MVIAQWSLFTHFVLLSRIQQLTPPTHSAHYPQSNRTSRGTSPFPPGDPPPVGVDLHQQRQRSLSPDPRHSSHNSPRHSPIFHRDKESIYIGPVTGKHSPTFVSVTINPKEEAIEPGVGPLGQVTIQTSDQPIADDDHSVRYPGSPSRKGKSPIGRGKSPSPTRMISSRSPSPHNGEFSFPPPTIGGNPPQSVHSPVPMTRAGVSTSSPPVPVTRAATNVMYSSPPLPPPHTSANTSSPFVLTSHTVANTSYSPNNRTPANRTSPLSLSPARQSPISHPREVNGGVNNSSIRDPQFAVEESAFNTTQPREYVEDPNMDSHFKAGDYSPKHSSSVKDVSGRKPVPRDRRAASQDRPIPKGRQERQSSFSKSKTDEELIEAVQKVFTSAEPDLSLPPRSNSPSPHGSQGATPPLTPSLRSPHLTHGIDDAIDHGGIGGDPLHHRHPYHPTQQVEMGVHEPLYNAPPPGVGTPPYGGEMRRERTPYTPPLEGEGEGDGMLATDHRFRPVYQQNREVTGTQRYGAPAAVQHSITADGNNW